MITQQLEWGPRNHLANILSSSCVQTIVLSGWGAAKDVGYRPYAVDYIG